MSDDLSRDLEITAGEVSAFPSNFGELRSLIATLPSPVAPDIRSAIAGAVNTVEPATAAQQVASALAGGSPGEQSGATLGVVSEIFYANANFLDNPTLGAITEPLALTAVLTEFADDWQAKVVLNSGAAPAVQTNLNDTRFAPNGFHPFNSHAVDLTYTNGAGASDVTVTVEPSSGTQIFFETELAYLVAAIKVTLFGVTIDANTTKINARLELWDVNGPGTLLATGTTIDFLGKSGDWNTYRLSVAWPLPASILGLYQFKPRLIVNFAKNSAGGVENLTFGEPVMALSAIQSPPPFSPIIARWTPSYLRVRNAGDTQNRLQVGVQSERESTASRLPEITWGAGGAAARDTRLYRPATSVLRLDNNGGGRAAMEFAAGATPGAAAAGFGRLWFNTANKHFYQTDDAGVDTDLTAAGGAATQVSLDAVAAAGDYSARIRVVGDPQYRGIWGLDSADVPRLLFGSGALTGDLKVYRAGAGDLGLQAVGVADAILDILGGSATARLRMRMSGDTQDRTILRGDSTLTSLQFGPGNAAQDWQLARDAANQASLSSGSILNLASGKLTLPVNTTAETTEGRMRWVTASNAAGAKVVMYDSQREREIGAQGWQPYCYPLGADPDQTYATNLALPISGGSIAIPFVVDGHMLLQSMTLRATAASGTGEFRIYRQRLNNGSAGENTLDEIPSSAGTIAAAGAAANVTSNFTSAPVYLGPGAYWIVIRCTSGATALNLGTLAAGTLAANLCQTKTLGVALASTLDFVAATWTKTTGIPGVRLNGRVFGQTAAF